MMGTCPRAPARTKPCTRQHAVLLGCSRELAYARTCTTTCWEMRAGCCSAALERVVECNAQSISTRIRLEGSELRVISLPV